jgi:hypothetical protein
MNCRALQDGLQRYDGASGQIQLNANGSVAIDSATARWPRRWTPTPPRRCLSARRSEFRNPILLNR